MASGASPWIGEGTAVPTPHGRVTTTTPSPTISAPLELCGRKTAHLVPHSTLRVYENAAYGLFVTHADQLNADLLAFAGVHRSRAPATAGA
jgi:hypothetical protein